ncbi:MAG: amidohydrolase [Clostridia bacterium]|nr:amidohydrolase [Clostridia bacterium]
MDSLALINGKVYIEKDKFAEAVYIEDGIIKVVGDSEEILGKTDWDTEIIDCAGRTVIPGLNDSHMHMLMVGTGLMEVKTSDVTSIDELVDRCKKYMEDNPELCKNGLYSMGFNQDLFTEGEKRIPNRHDLDRISTDIPVIMARVCGHVTSCNTKVIEMLGLEKGAQPWDGGTVELEEDGYPSGIFTEQCGERLHQTIPPHTKEDIIKAFTKAQEYAISRGLTSIQTNDVGQCELGMDATFATIHEIYDRGMGKLRYRHQVCVSSPEELQHFIDTEWKNGKYEDPRRLALGPLKLFKDGSLGGRTALLRHEYLDDPGNFGVESISDECMDTMCKMAADAGMQIITHSIGDGAIEKMINSYEKVGATGVNPLRHAIVHCQITDKELLQRIKDDNILIFYQPVFLDYDLHAVIPRVGRELSSTSYAFKSARDMGIHCSYGTDSPVEDCNPFHCICHAVTRKDTNGEPYFGFFPAECVSVEEAIDDYTIGSAYAEFAENFKGRIKPGYLADMLILDTDIFSCDPLEIYDVLPDMTIIGGELVYKKN